MGHLKQSLAAASWIEGGESRVVSVNYSFFTARLLLTLASYFPFKKKGGGLLLKWFLKSETFNSILGYPAEIIISAGAGISITNLLAAKVLSAKSIVIMKPPGGGQHRYALRIIPEHDLPKRLPNTVITLGAPTAISPDLLLSEAKKLASSLKLTNRKIASVFIGGNTSKYRFDPEKIFSLIETLKQFCESHHFDLLITTSRRTPKEVDMVLKQAFSIYPHCKLLTIWRENPKDCVAGMLGLSEWVLVTEDSISMISDAVNSGKKVIVLKMNKRGGLKRKQRHFLQALEER
ncbi:MAG: ELM1/GtrOC1 family putative glycosyltransferase, partial [Deltaproteobacteria bacterium]